MEISCLWKGSDSIEAVCSSMQAQWHPSKGGSAKRSSGEAVLPHWLKTALIDSILNS